MKSWNVTNGTGAAAVVQVTFDKDYVLVGCYYGGNRNVLVSTRPDTYASSPEFNTSSTSVTEIIAAFDDAGGIGISSFQTLSYPVRRGESVFVASDGNFRIQLFLEDILS
jgi:hypothetical protein